MMMKKVISVWLSVLMLFSAFSAMQLTAMAEDSPVTYTEGDFEYDLTPTGNARITKYNGTAAALEIPDVLGGYAVSVIGGSAFKGCKDLISVTMPDSVISISGSAFSECSNLASVQFSDNLLYIGINAFSHCSSLTSIEIPDSVIRISTLAFDRCTNLADITVPDTAIEISVSAFEDTAYYNDANNWRNDALYIGNHLIQLFPNAGIVDYVVEDGTKTIAMGAFGTCRKTLISIEIPNSVIRISTGNFFACPHLTDVILPDTDIQIGEMNVPMSWLLANENLLPEEDIYFGNHLIMAAPNKQDNFTVKDGTVTIADGALGFCENVTELTLPNSLKRIGAAQSLSVFGLLAKSGAFKEVNVALGEESSAASEEEELTEEMVKEMMLLHLKDIYYDGTEEEWKQVAFTDDKTAYINYTFIESENNIEVSVTNEEIFHAIMHYQTKTEGDFKYEITPSGNARITKYNGTAAALEIPDVLGGYAVSVIGNSAFKGCKDLKSVTMPDSVISISGSAFSECSNLASVQFSDNLLYIGMNAFSHCSSLTSIEIPDSVIYIDTMAFFRCTSLTDITIPDISITISLSVFSDTAYYNDANNWRNHALYIGNHLIEVDKNAGIVNYVVEDGTKTIASNAFWPCQETLISVEVPESVIRISPLAFWKCNNLTDIILPDTDLEIGDMIIPASWLWSGNENSFPKEDIYIGNHLIMVAAQDTDNHIVKDGTITIADSAFGLCKNVTSITLPNSLKRIGAAQSVSWLKLHALESEEFKGLTEEEKLNKLWSLNLKDIYYDGTEEEWKQVVFTDDKMAYVNYASVESDSDFLLSNEEFLHATMHFKNNSSETPETPQPSNPTLQEPQQPAGDNNTTPQNPPEPTEVPLPPTIPATTAKKVKLSLKKVAVKKSAKKLVLKATLKINGKAVKGKKVTFKFNGKKYTAKTNKKGVAKVTVKKSVLKKLKKGKKITYSVKYGKKTVKKTAKVK